MKKKLRTFSFRKKILRSWTQQYDTLGGLMSRDLTDRDLHCICPSFPTLMIQYKMAFLQSTLWSCKGWKFQQISEKEFPDSRTTLPATDAVHFLNCEGPQGCLYGNNVSNEGRSMKQVDCGQGYKVTRYDFKGLNSDSDPRL